MKKDLLAIPLACILSIATLPSAGDATTYVIQFGVR